jgi:hypothetical protein
LVGKQYFGGAEWLAFNSVRTFLLVASQQTNSITRGILEGFANDAAVKIAAEVRAKDRVICSTLVWHSYHDALGVDLNANKVVPGLRAFAGKPNPTQATLQLLAAKGVLIVPDSLAFDGGLTRVTSRGSAAIADERLAQEGGIGSSAPLKDLPLGLRNASEAPTVKSTTIKCSLVMRSLQQARQYYDGLLNVVTNASERTEPTTTDIFKSTQPSQVQRPSQEKALGLRARAFGITLAIGMVACLLNLTTTAYAQVSLQSNVSTSSNLFVYQYTAFNQTSSPVIGIAIEVFGEVTAIQSPNGWIADVSDIGPRSLVSWFSTMPGQSDIASSGTRSGFSFRSAFSPGPVGYSATNTAFNFLEGVTTGPISIAGDYNSDGVVNSADYNLWRQYFGTSNTPIADGNANRQVDAADYTVWRDQKTGNDSAVAVPEPHTAVLILVASFPVSRRLFALGRCS